MSTTLTTHPEHARLAAEADRGRDPSVGFKGAANNTTIRRADPDDETSPVIVRLHETDIVTIFANGRVMLDSGGWQTVTTKARMNAFAPGIVISQKQHVWYVRLPGQSWDDEHATYVEGFTYDIETGETFHDVDEAERAREQREELRDAIRKYAREFPVVEAAQRLVNGDIMGDCFGCQFRDAEDRTRESMGTGHLHRHLAEGYHVPTLLLNAYRHRYNHERARQAHVAESLIARIARSEGSSSGVTHAREYIRAYLKAHLFDGQEAR